MRQGSTYYSTIRIKIYFASRSIPRSESKQDKVRSSSRRKCLKNVINKNSKVRMAAGNFGISKQHKLIEMSRK
jgi:hypothetical protein